MSTEEAVQPLRSTIKLQREYIELLTEELNEVLVIAYIHGWRSTRAEQGVELRKKLFDLTKDPYYAPKEQTGTQESSLEEV